MISVWWLVFIAISVISITGAFVWVAWRLDHSRGRSDMTGDILSDAQKEVERIFNDEFREELRNRGRLHFEKIINDNAMFLQQDLQLTASNLNEFMQDEIKKVLKEEFAKYEQSIEGAKEVAIQSIQKTQKLLEDHRQAMSKQLQAEVEKEKQAQVHRFEEHMSQIVNHYLLNAIGNEIDIDDQMDYIFRRLEDNKVDIIDDLKNSA